MGLDARRRGRPLKDEKQERRAEVRALKRERGSVWRCGCWCRDGADLVSAERES